MEILIVLAPMAVIAAFWFFARTIKKRRQVGRNYEFRHPLPGSYGGNAAEIPSAGAPIVNSLVEDPN